MTSLANKTVKDNPTIRAPGPGCVRVGPVAAVPALLQAYADDPVEQILAEVGLDLELFDDPENDIAFVTVGHLLNQCAKHTGLPHFGLLLGQRAGPETVGQMGELAVHAPTVESALHGMIMHICTNDRGGVPTLTSKNGVASLGYSIYVPMHEGISQIYSTSITITYNLLRSMCGESFAATEVRFSHSRPSDIKPYKDFFQVPLIFEADEDAIIFPDHWLKKSLPNSNVELHKDALRRLTTIESEMSIDLLEEIHMVLRPLVISQCSTPERVASMLSLHPRTLNRRLQEHGTTLRSLVGEIRYEIAKQMLADSSMSVLAISTLLGYADASIFTRAFRRWSGMTPSAWRMQKRQ